jgi:CubicO group peptidase (beta-lactamase class C family)
MTWGNTGDRLDHIVPAITQRFVDPGMLPGGHLRIEQGGNVLLDQCFGQMDIARQQAWRNDAIVRIYSMTKPIVSVALMMLWERGLFRLDQPIGDVWPGWRDQRVWVSGAGGAMITEPAKVPITFRHLLTHCGGLTYGTSLAGVGGVPTVDPVALTYLEAEEIGKTQGLDVFAAAIGKLPLRYQPGARWMYSYSTDIVAALIQTLSGKSLETFLSEEIFEPLGMVDTGFHVREEQVDRLSACYMVTPQNPMMLVDDGPTSVRRVAPQMPSGGGGLTSTLTDYARFTAMLRGKGRYKEARLLAPTTVRLMTRNHLPDGRDLTGLALISDPRLVPGGMGFGLGFGITTDAVRAGLPAEGDFYWSGAASTIWWHDPAHDMTVIFLTQLLPTTAYGLQDWLKQIVYAALPH